MAISTERLCPNCGARHENESTKKCRFCGKPVLESASTASPISRSVHSAASAWARGIFGAPRGFADLITTVDVRDEILERVVTEVVHRDVREERLPTAQPRRSPPNVDPRAVDPFAISAEELRTKSEYVTACGHCNGGGFSRCPPCAGSGRARCGNCGGGGQVLKQYKKSSKMVKCSVCRGGGTVDCGNCGGNGNVTCPACAGNGRQLVWLTYDQRSFWSVKVVPNSPILAAHRQLGESRPLSESELDAFSILAIEASSGPVTLDGYRGSQSAVVRDAIAAIDSRLERVNYQQYLKLAIVRRDAAFEMCGASGTLVLSGSDLVAARTHDAMHPLTRRLYAWAGIAGAFAIASGILFGQLRGSTSYFDGTNSALLVTWLFAIALAIPPLGGVLRALRPGMRLGPLQRTEKGLAGGALAALVAMGVIGLVARPSIREVQQDLRKGNVSAARAAVDALKETRGSTPDVLEANDAVVLAEAKALDGDQRLALLDAVGSRGGSLAAQASSLARADRLASINQMIDAKLADPAIGKIDRWFPETWKGDHDLAEARARANDVALSLCTDEACRFQRAEQARAASATPEREQRAVEARSHLLAVLEPSEVPGEDSLKRLQRLRVVGATARKSVDVAVADADVVAKAKTAAAWSTAERAKVALVGADQRTVEELLGATATTEGKVTWLALDTNRVYLSLDAQQKCRGLYVVGAEKGARTIHGKTWGADQIVSQATGRTTMVKKPADTATASRWSEGWVPVAARWRQGELVELRIGDATP